MVDKLRFGVIIVVIMPRKKRKILGGYVYHVLNRANGKLRIFKKPDDFAAFEELLAQGQERFGMRVCGYCLMSNHWHLLLWPEGDGDLAEFMKWITVTHTMRYHAAHGTTGMGHIYQGRYKSFPVQGNASYLKVLRYIEANPLRAKLVDKAEEWPWSSYRHHIGVTKPDTPLRICKGPRPIPRNWPEYVLNKQTKLETDTIQNAIKRGCPLGDTDWIETTARKLELESTLKPIGRPKTTMKGDGPL